MNKLYNSFLSVLIVLCSLCTTSHSQTIEQRLVIVENQLVLNGNFRVQVQVKGTNLPAANTLGSATIDVQFDNTHLAFVNGTLWAFGGAQGYSRTAFNNTTFIRVGVTGGAVNENGGGDPPGFDIGSTYASWVQLNFTILNPNVTTTLIINNITNAIGLFENYQNEPLTGVINNQPLSAPENITATPLPVELSSFTSKLINDKVQLNWQTKTEVSNYGFNVERSLKGGEWSTIGFVEGYGNSNSPKSYSFSDKDLFAGGSEFRYRLKQIDTDGKFEYSDVVAVTVIPSKFELAQNYPNPFNPATTIRFSLPQSAQVKLNLYNLLGQQIATIAEGLYEQGFHKVEFNADNLSSGAYIYRLESADFVQTKKMVLIK